MIELAAMTSQHWPDVELIYAAGIAGGNATFETATPSWPDFDRSRLADHRFVALLDGRVAGWIAVSATSNRPAYAGVVEHSVYVHPELQQRGVARALLAGLIESTEAAGIWTIQSGVFGENVGSLALHRQLGFRPLGIRERVGRHHGRWRDVILIERRSPVVGRD